MVVQPFNNTISNTKDMILYLRYFIYLFPIVNRTI